ncbi:hypothetical protein HDU91_004654 [Kappamyces sp. JEL0680]|nr:hypothetical protein HDU91_004654 [Kappamyces sp. JEL0680]
MVTPRDHPTGLLEATLTSPKPSTRLISLDRDLETPRPKKIDDPFRDETTIKAVKSHFVIKSPFSSSFKSFLDRSVAEDGQPGKESDATPPVLETDNFFEAEHPDLTEDPSKPGQADSNSDGESTVGEPSGESWLDRGPLDMYNNLNGGSKIVDDFFQLKKEMDEMISFENHDFNNILDEDFMAAGRGSLLMADNRSLGADSVFSNDNVVRLPHIDEFSSILPGSTTIDHQTPHTTRTLQSISDDLFSPGLFFGSRSGRLGDLESKDRENRPTWYTPKHDSAGKLIDPIGKTPGERLEKAVVTETPAGNRLVRKPLYVPTPSQKTGSGRTLAPLLPANEAEKAEVLDSESQQDQRHSASFVDPFDWQSAFEKGADETALEVNLKNTSPKHKARSAAGCKVLRLSDQCPVYIKVQSRPQSPTLINLSVVNDAPTPQSWTLKPIGPGTLQRDKAHSLADRNVFGISPAQGELAPQSSCAVSITFLPLLSGLYKALFHLTTTLGVVAIWVEGQSDEQLDFAATAASSASSASLKARQHEKLQSNMANTDISQIVSSFRKSQTSSATPSITLPLAAETPSTRPKEGLLPTPQLDPKGPEARQHVPPRETPRITSASSPSPKRMGVSMSIGSPRNLAPAIEPSRLSLQFGEVKKGGSKTLQLRVCNPDEKDATVSFLTTGQFILPVKEVVMTPRSFFVLPVCFAPTHLGKVSERLVVKKNGISTVRIVLLGATR